MLKLFFKNTVYPGEYRILPKKENLIKIYLCVLYNRFEKKIFLKKYKKWRIREENVTIRRNKSMVTNSLLGLKSCVGRIVPDPNPKILFKVSPKPKTLFKVKLKIRSEIENSEYNLPWKQSDLFFCNEITTSKMI